VKPFAVVLGLALLAANLAAALWLIDTQRHQECLTRNLVLTNARQAPYNGRIIIPGTDNGPRPLILDATWRVDCGR
jgi:hypothetical protein